MQVHAQLLDSIEDPLLKAALTVSSCVQLAFEPQWLTLSIQHLLELAGGVVQEPVAFWGGAFAGILGLDLSQDPLRGWLERTSVNAGVRPLHQATEYLLRKKTAENSIPNCRDSHASATETLML